MNQEQLQQSPERRIAYQRRSVIDKVFNNTARHADFDVNKSLEEQNRAFAEYAQAKQQVEPQVPESIGSTVVEIEANSTTEARRAVEDALMQEFGNAN